MLDLEIPVAAGQHIRGAFLCLHRIPIEAIVETRNPGEVETDKFSMLFLRLTVSGR